MNGLQCQCQCQCGLDATVPTNKRQQALEKEEDLFCANFDKGRIVFAFNRSTLFDKEAKVRVSPYSFL